MDDVVAALAGGLAFAIEDHLVFEGLAGFALVEGTEAGGFGVLGGEAVGGVAEEEFEDFYELLAVLLGGRVQGELVEHGLVVFVVDFLNHKIVLDYRDGGLLGGLDGRFYAEI